MRSPDIRSTKRLVSVNTCSVEGNSGGDFPKHSAPWNFRNKEKMNAYYFWEDKTTVLGAIKGQLPFSDGKYQLLNSLIKFRSLDFSIIWIFS